MTKAVIYPRGFLGFDIGLPVTNPKQPAMQAVITAMRNNRAISEIMPPPYIHNEAIDLLWNEYRCASVDYNPQLMIENVITTVVRAFGTTDFHEWLSIQTQSPFLADNQIRFLNDTMRFINTGERGVSPMVWKSILTQEKASATGKQKLLIEDFFNGSLCVDENLPISSNTFDVITNIVKWMRQPDGLTDLLCSMSILFGKRDNIN